MTIFKQVGKSLAVMVTFALAAAAIWLMMLYPVPS